MSGGPVKTSWDDRPRFALAADVTVYWPDVRPCWEPSQDDLSGGYAGVTDANAQSDGDF